MAVTADLGAECRQQDGTAVLSDYMLLYAIGVKQRQGSYQRPESRMQTAGQHRSVVVPRGCLLLNTAVAWRLPET
jgi:hypothetical protein